MNMKVFKFIAIMLILAGSFASCKDETDENVEKHQDGIPPSSIKDVVDVFELKYGDIYEGIYDGKIMKLSITDVKDSLQRCDLLDYEPEMFNTIRIHAFLHVETTGIASVQKVSSKTCGPNSSSYQNDGTDVKQIIDMLNGWQSDSFTSMFNWSFGEGTLLSNTSFSIYMAKAYPFAYEINTIPQKNMYKFIFIITKE